MPQQATIDAEIADLQARLSYETDTNVRSAAQDRVNSLRAQGGRAPVYGSAEHEKTKGKK